MNIGFEAKRFFTNYTGLGNYSRFVVDALSQSNPDDQLFLFTPRIVDHAENRQILKRSNVKAVAPSGLYGMPLMSALWRTWGVSKNPIMKDLHVFHGLSQEIPLGLPQHVKKVVTVHDLIFLRYPQFYNSVDVAIYTRKVRAACEMADRVIAISQQTADDIVNLLKVNVSDKIDVVYQGCHPIFKRKALPDELATVKKKYSIPDRFILNVGTVEERKNLMVVVKALASMSPQDRLPLVVVGRHTSYFNEVLQQVQQAGLTNSVYFLDNVDFQDLPAIYQQAELFVYPSLFEGFGIPLIEAITSGIPVITSQGSCFREAAGPGGTYVDPTHAENFAKEMLSLLQDTEKRRLKIQEGLSYIQQFEPHVIAGKLKTIYGQLVHQPASV